VILRTLESDRMTLVAATQELIEADLADSGKLAELLSAEVPDNWPPDLYERQAMQFALEQLRGPVDQAGWSFWYLLTRSAEQPQVLGICGFKGRPDEAGSVEISYSVLSQYRQNGYATEAVTRLVSWAFSHQNVAEVCAETLPYLQQSIRVLEKNGFSFTGPGSEQGVVRYAVQRPDQR
jgi:ribosomal-protein-alanine N-acetyltransferase